MSSPPNHVPIGRYKNTRCGFSTTGSLFQPFSHHLPNLFSSSCPQQPAVTANPSVTIFPTSSPHPVLNLLLSSLHFLLWPRLASTFLNLNSPLLKAIASWMGWCDTPYSPLLKAIASWMGWCDAPYSPLLKTIASRMGWCDAPYSPLLKAIASRMGWCDTPYSPLLKAKASWMGWCDTPTRQSEGQGRVQRVCVCVCVCLFACLYVCASAHAYVW